MNTSVATDIKTLTDLMRIRGEETPSQTALYFDGVAYTYGDMHENAGRVAGFLQSCGVSKGDRVILLIPNGPEFFHYFYGTLMLGAVAVPLFPGTAPERNLRIAALCDARCLILPSDVSEEELHSFQSQAVSIQGLSVFRTDAAVDATPLTQRPDVMPHDLAFLQFTSGSTGDPKGVMLSHECLTTNVRQMIEGMCIAADDVFVSWLPVYHDMGLILMTLAPFYVGAPLVLLPTSLSNVTQWFKAIQTYGGTFTAAPDFAYRLCNRYRRKLQHYDITSLRVALNAAEPVRGGTITAFEDNFGLRHILQGGYGLAECTVGVSMHPPGEPMRVDERGLVSVGKPFPLINVSIRDGEGVPVAPHTIGRIVVHSPANCQGYFQNDTATQNLFQRDGSLDTGDLGYMDEKGHLFIAGRLKNVIITGGRTIANQEIEETVDSHPSVRASAAVGIDRGKVEGEQAFVFAEIRKGGSLSETERENLVLDIVETINHKLGFRPGRVYLVKNHTIPKTYNGKIQHAALREAWRDGSLRDQGKVLYPDY